MKYNPCQPTVARWHLYLYYSQVDGSMPVSGETYTTALPNLVIAHTKHTQPHMHAQMLKSTYTEIVNAQKVLSELK